MGRSFAYTFDKPLASNVRIDRALTREKPIQSRVAGFRLAVQSPLGCRGDPSSGIVHAKCADASTAV
jgi:hypothetical protein